MKKISIFRLFAIAIFCLASLAIKSETSSCKSYCACASQSATVKRLASLSDNEIPHDYKTESLFIKI